MKKIRITVITRNSDYLQRLANRLCEEKDMSLFSSIVINNFKSEMKQSIAFLEQTFLTQPDVLLLDQTILRDAAAIDVQQVLAYRDKLNSTKFIIVGERYNEESVMAEIEAGVRGFFGLRWAMRCSLNAFVQSPREKSGLTPRWLQGFLKNSSKKPSEEETACNRWLT